jgi:hypothetical protein
MDKSLPFNFIVAIFFLGIIIVNQAGATDPINTLLDNQNLTFTYYGPAPYRASTDSVAGGSSLQSGAIGDNQSCYVQTTVNGPGKISYYSKISSQQDHDYAGFLIDDVVITFNSGEVDWKQDEFDIPAGTHTLKWGYQKDASGSAGLDCAWLDKVVYTSQSPSIISVNPASLSNSCQQGQNAAGQSFEVWNSGGGTLNYTITDDAAWLSVTPASGTSTGEHDTITVNYSTADLTAGTYNAVISVSATGLTSKTISVTLTVSPGVPTITLNQALDNMALSFSTSGNANWFGEATTWQYGGSAAQSGEVNDSQASRLQTTVTGPGTMTFYFKVSSETYYDGLGWYLDGVWVEGWSGEKDWTQYTLNISAGSHTVLWEYSKDSSNSAGQDCGWVDKVVYTAGGKKGKNPLGGIFLLLLN